MNRTDGTLDMVLAAGLLTLAGCIAAILLALSVCGGWSIGSALARGLGIGA